MIVGDLELKSVLCSSTCGGFMATYRDMVSLVGLTHT